MANNGWMFRIELITQLGRAHGLWNYGIVVTPLRSGSHKPFIYSFQLLDTFALRVYISNHPTSFSQSPLPAFRVSMSSLEILQPEP
jgi:hypothetical protein